MSSIPGPRETDAEDVALKLEVAQTQWARGDHAEALKWLRKAADAAFDADDDKRGIELSKLAAELTAQDKVAPKPKPKLPPPRESAPAPKIIPPKPVVAPPAPQVRAPAPAAPVQESPASRRGGDPKLSATGARRAAAARAAEARAASQAKPEPVPVSRRGKSSRKSSPDLDDESTREYLVADVAKSRAVDLTKTRSDVRAPSPPEEEEWPTEAVDNVDELEAHERTEPHGASHPKRRAADKTEREQPGAAVAVPFTQALRVAVGRAPDGRVVVRLLDGNGLREGEKDALLVALTNEPMTTLFGGG